MNTRPILSRSFVLALLLLTACGTDSSHDAAGPVSPTPEAIDRSSVSLAIEAELQSLEVYDPAHRNGSLLRRPYELGPRDVITVPAGSVDALGSAIAAAGPGGVVRVERGVHVESRPVVIESPVTIVGMPGAVIETGVGPYDYAPDSTFEAAFYVVDADGEAPGARGRVTIAGLTIRPAAGAFGGAGVLIENTSGARILFNEILAHQAGVVLQFADDARILGNRIEIEPSVAEHGITVINGKRAGIARNTISGAFFGMWACDEDGVALWNTFTNNVIGLIYCKVPTPAYPLPSGNTTGSLLSATRWYGEGNTSSGNDWGYMIVDGSTDCSLVRNAASDNTLYDVHVVPDTEVLFGFCTPTAVNSFVLTLDDDDVIKDCGVNSTIIGGTLVDTNVDPCEPPCTGAAPAGPDAGRRMMEEVAAKTGR